MKIAVCGKGGSGKSTIVAIVAQEFQRRNQRVLVIDADESNSGLHWMLGIEKPPVPLMEFVGGKKKIQGKMIAGFTTEDDGTGLSLWKQNEIPMDAIPRIHAAGPDNCRLVVTGKIDRNFEGCACPMGVVAREFLKKLKIGRDQMVIVDMEAGIEHFGRGIESSLDAVLAVVEPSLESLSIAAKTRTLTEAGGARFAGAVINKVRSEQNQDQLIQALAHRDITELGCLWFHERLVDNGLCGRPVDLQETGTEAGAIADQLLDFVHGKPTRDVC